MADIVSSTVFTNGVSCGTSDLLRQAFQEVVGEEDHDEFVAYLQGEDIESHAIQLTQAQASALRLNFGDSVVEQTNNITYHHEQNVILNDVQNTGSLQTGESSPSHDGAVETLNFQTPSASEISNVIKIEYPQLQDWATQELPQNGGSETRSVPMQNLEASQDLLQQLANHQSVQKIYVQQNSVRAAESNGVRASDNNIRFTVKETIPQQNFQQNNVQPRTSQAQILQRLPVILPSSQFIIKPAQTILKPNKNVKILPTTSKIGGVGAINGKPGQGTILLPKGALNTLSPQILKATPIGTQLINTSGISTQLLNTSQILTTNSGFQSQNGNVGGAKATQNLINTQIQLSPVIKPSTGMIQRSNGQQFVVPTLKTAQNSTIIKSVQLSNGSSMKTNISGQFLKSVQIPAHLLRSANTTFLKATTTTPTSTKVSTTTSTPVIFRTTSLLKAHDFKTVTTTASTVVRPPQSPSTPISILKPQTKGVVSNANKQNVVMNGQSPVATPPMPRFVTKPASAQKKDANVKLKTAPTSVKHKATESAAPARVVKKAKITVPVTSPVALTPRPADTTKPLGSSENPIQIVQQGQTFHSMQRLTQAQLKQIAHVLQQRSQESAMPNEKVVYRVVFPEELDLRTRTPANLGKTRTGKRGRPKKSAAKPAAPASKTPILAEEEHPEAKDDRKKVVARTRSGRLSRPPRHMVRDYKHIHHLDFTQPDIDDSDGGYSDYNTNAEKLAAEGSPKELLTGLEVQKRKISPHFRCPTCSKIYLGRSRMARHFDVHPDHGSADQLPPETPERERKRAQDPLKRKGKKRGPWAYVTPEAKSERRQLKLREAIAVCDNREITNVAAKPVLNAHSLFDLVVLKSENNVRTFLDEFKGLMDKAREQIGEMLTAALDGESATEDVVDLRANPLCEALGLLPGIYKVNNDALRKPEEPSTSGSDTTASEEPPLKIQKSLDIEEKKDSHEDILSSGFSESSDISGCEFLTEPSANLPSVEHSPISSPEVTTSNNMSNLLISNPEIQSQISESPGFQKIDINSTKSYRKMDGLAKLTESLDLDNCSPVFAKLDGMYEEPKMQTLQPAFIKLQPMKQGFKLENSTVSSYAKENSQIFEKIESEFESITTESVNFVSSKGFQLLTKTEHMENEESCVENEASQMNGNDPKMLRNECKISGSLPILQDTVQIMSSACDHTSIFGSTDNLDMSKMTGYDHIPHLDMLASNEGMDKHLIMDEKLVDELVSERLKNIMPDNILENNLMPNGSNIDAELDFEAISEEFNRNTRS